MVLDAELVAVDREKANELKSFQELSTRARGAITSLEVPHCTTPFHNIAVRLTLTNALCFQPCFTNVLKLYWGSSWVPAGRLLPFRLMHAGLNAYAWMPQVKVPVCVFAFDCLYVDGESLLKQPLQERRERLAAALPSLRPGFVCLAQSHVLQAPAAAAAAAAPELPAQPAGSPDTVQAAPVPPATPDRAAARPALDLGGAVEVDAAGRDDVMQLGAAAVGAEADAGAAAEGAQSAAEAGTEALIREHLQDALAAGTEGLMLKALTGPSATYQPSKRSNSWLKIKR